MHVITRVVIIVSCLYIAASSAWAQSDPQVQAYLDSAARFECKLFEAKASLESRDPAEWNDAELADYQVNMGVAVYNAVVAYCIENDRLPYDLTEVAGFYLAEWPLNPLNNWEPVKVLGLGDGFAAGELVYQECPVSYYSISGRIRDLTLEAKSFELSVYGPSIDHYQETSLNLANGDWGVIPVGAIISMGMYTEPADEVIARLRAREEEARLAAAKGELAVKETEE